jgi:hypothetical protein
MQIEVCENCDTKIGPDEQAFILNNHIVCEECYKIDYVKIAKFRCYLLLAIMTFIILSTLIAIVYPKESFLLFFKPIVSVYFIAMLIIVITLMRAMKWHIINIVLCTIGSLFPFVCLFCWIFIVRDATRLLRLAGYKVL